MNREEAYQFIQLYKIFTEIPGIEISDYTNAGTVELEIANPSGYYDRNWYDDWTAAKIIEANS